MKKPRGKDKGFSMDDVQAIVEKFDTSIVKEYRQKRQYNNSILAKNEIERDDPYNKKLFLRIGHGVYILNPDLEIAIGDDNWMNVYDMLHLEKMTRERNEQRVEEEKAEMKAAKAEFREMAREAEAARREREHWKRWKW